MAKLVLLAILLSGCAKFSYVAGQSWEQVRLVTAGENIKDVLQKDTVSTEIKKSLKDIIQYKKFFYDYFEEEPNDIYQKVILLDRKAVSHLVITSSWEEIKAKEECFPVVGCFPYLGFFDSKKAIKYQMEMEKMGFSSHSRPVYAYSTLGKFNDRILSSFFNYSKRGLSNLIFHELVHAHIFFKNGVSFNENLASFFADQLNEEYFEDNQETKRVERLKLKSKKEIREIINTNTVEINDYLFKIPKSEKRMTLKKLINEKFGKKFKQKTDEICEKNQISKKWCESYQIEWTPSKLAAIGTYNSLRDDIENYYNENFNNLKEFYNFLKQKYVNGESAKSMIKIIKSKN